jgi:AAA domain-containing protein
MPTGRQRDGRAARGRFVGRLRPEARQAGVWRRLGAALAGPTALLAVATLYVAVTGGPVKFLGVELPQIHGVGIRLLLGLLAGLVLVACALAYLPRLQAIELPKGAEALPVPMRVPDSYWGTSSLPQHTPYFNGRERQLDELRGSLAAGRPTVLVGMAGVGKTQPARTYVERSQAQSTKTRPYDLVWWIRAEQAATLAGDYAALARELELPERADPNQDVVVAAVRRWLERNRRWLLVFDNAEHGELLRPFLPTGTHGHILITSQDRLWADAPVIELQPWARAESRAFLRAFARPSAGRPGKCARRPSPRA